MSAGGGGEASWGGPVVLLSNDDGVMSQGIVELAAAVLARGWGVVVVGPARDQSACGMQLSLGKPLAFEERPDIVDRVRTLAGDAAAGVPVRVFSIDGTPCDCMILALDGGLARWVPGLRPRLMVSGVNMGPNLSVDVLHSGTVGAAREASLYGLPAVATSLGTLQASDISSVLAATLELLDRVMAILPADPPDLLRPDGVAGRDWTLRTTHGRAAYPHLPDPAGRVVDEEHSATAELARRVELVGAVRAEAAHEVLREAFSHADVMLNLNVAEAWNGGFRTTRLGSRWYRNVLEAGTTPEGLEAYVIGGATVDDEATLDSDIDAVHAGFASVTTMPVWPAGHPLEVSGSLRSWAREAGADGLPAWLGPV